MEPSPQHYLLYLEFRRDQCPFFSDWCHLCSVQWKDQWQYSSVHSPMDILIHNCSWNSIWLTVAPPGVCQLNLRSSPQEGYWSHLTCAKFALKFDTAQLRQPVQPCKHSHTSIQDTLSKLFLKWLLTFFWLTSCPKRFSTPYQHQINKFSQTHNVMTLYPHHFVSILMGRV